MATTTWSAIATIMHTQIKAITPTSFSGTKFRRQPPEVPFREYAMDEGNVKSVTRKYAVVHLHEYDAVQISDFNAKIEPQMCQVVVAYDPNWPKNDRDLLDQIIDEDRRAIDAVVGMDSTAYPNSCMINPEFGIEREDSVWLLTMTYQAIYHRSV